MSLINDALKRARHTPPRNPNSPFPPLPPADDQSTSAKAWLLPAIVIALIVAAIFFIGLAMARHSVRNIVDATSASVMATQAVAEVVASPAVEPPPAPLNPPDAPRLQGIFYSPTSPSAIVDGKTVRKGDHFQQYRVTEITKYTVTLIGPDGKAIKLGMAN